MNKMDRLWDICDKYNGGLAIQRICGHWGMILREEDEKEIDKHFRELERYMGYILDEYLILSNQIDFIKEM